MASTAPFKNHLLSQLGPGDLALLTSDLEQIDLPVRRILETPNKPIKYAYFIEYGLASIVATNKHKSLEVGLAGCEGMTGVALVLGRDRSPSETFMQIAGEGNRIPADKLKAAMEQSRQIERVLLDFACATLNQTVNTALSNGTATVEERLARWLLMAHDRLRGDEIPLTHEFLSLMLGVRRAGVTTALHELAKKALIKLLRGQIFVLDRDGLKAHANGSYHEPRWLRQK